MSCKHIQTTIDELIDLYINQDIATSITFQGLEPLDNLQQLLTFIYFFRQLSFDNIYIWTGYDEFECEALLKLIQKMKWKNMVKR